MGRQELILKTGSGQRQRQPLGAAHDRVPQTAIIQEKYMHLQGVAKVARDWIDELDRRPSIWLKILALRSTVSASSRRLSPIARRRR